MHSQSHAPQVEDAKIVEQAVNPDQEQVEVLDIFAEFATDEVAEDSGTWFPYGKTARFLIARSGNRAYQKAMAQSVERRRVELQDPAIAARVSDEVMAEIIGSALLKGWEGVVYKKKPIPFSVDNAIELLKHREFRRFVAACADSVEAFRAKEELEQGEA